MPTATVLDLITASLIKLRVHRPGSDVPPEDAQDAADELSRLIETWQVDGSMVYRMVDLAHPIVPGQATYTIGVGGDIDTPRPVALHDGYTRIGDVDTPYAIVHAEQYATISLKAQQATWPNYVYYEPAYPLGILHPWPIPMAGTLHVLVDQPFEDLALNDTLNFPLGYRDALVFSLGKRLAPSYGTSLTGEFLSDYTLAMRVLTRANKRPVIATVRLPVGGRRGTDTSWITHGGF